MFWDDRGGGLTGQPMGPQVDTANMRTVLSTNHVDSRSFSSRCWAFRRTHPSADPIRLLGIRLALPLTLSLPSGFVPSTTLMVGASPRALGLVKDCSCDCMFRDERGGGLAPVGPRVDTATIRTVLSTMLCVSTYTHERRPYSATLYPTSFTLDSSLALTIRVQRQTYGWWYTLCLMACGGFFV